MTWTVADITDDHIALEDDTGRAVTVRRNKGASALAADLLGALNADEPQRPPIRHAIAQALELYAWSEPREGPLASSIRAIVSGTGTGPIYAGQMPPGQLAWIDRGGIDQQVHTPAEIRVTPAVQVYDSLAQEAQSLKWFSWLSVVPRGSSDRLTIPAVCGADTEAEAVAGLHAVIRAVRQLILTPPPGTAERSAQIEQALAQARTELDAASAELSRLADMYQAATRHIAHAARQAEQLPGTVRHLQDRMKALAEKIDAL